MIIPIFTSHHSQISTLTLEKAQDEIDDAAPISIFSIAKKHVLSKIYLCEKRFSGFLEAYQESQKLKKQLIYGIKFDCCADAKDKSDESLKTYHKIIVWIKNTEGYKDLCKIYSEAFAKEEHFYYNGRLDLNILKSFWTDNLLLSIPFYDSFIHQNLMTFDNIIPDFGAIKFNLLLQNNNLPFDRILRQSVVEYACAENLETQECQSVYYYNSNCFKAYQIYRCILNRTSFEKPNLDFFGSDEFSFESYLEKKNERV